MGISNIKMSGNVSENTLQASTLETKGSNEISFWRKSKNNLVSIEEGFVCNNLKVVFKGGQ